MQTSTDDLLPVLVNKQVQVDDLITFKVIPNILLIKIFENMIIK